MDVFVCAFLVTAVVVAVVQLVRLALADGDLTLMFSDKFGKPVASLSNKVIWITGASSGIGRALAIELARVHCRVVLSARTESELEQTKKTCVELGALEENVMVLPMDVINLQLHESMVQKVLERFGKIDVLVLNAGRSMRADFETVDIAVDRDLFELNVFSQVNLATVVLKHFLESKQGHVVVMSSTAGKAAAPAARSYAASKHALHGYFECLRLEKGNLVDVTMLCPGPVFSNILKSAYTNKLGQETGLDFHPTDRRMSTDRCAHLSAVAIANKLDEAWICQQPILMYYYGIQYLPSVTRWFMKKVGYRQALALRDGRK